MEGGVIQDVQAPKGIRVVVRDYDTDGVETERLQRDEDGNEFIEAIWECPSSAFSTQGHRPLS
jgi:ferredoxin